MAALKLNLMLMYMLEAIDTHSPSHIKLNRIQTTHTNCSYVQITQSTHIIQFHCTVYHTIHEWTCLKSNHLLNQIPIESDTVQSISYIHWSFPFTPID